MPSCRQGETGASLEGETQAATTQESPNTSTLIIPTPVLRLASALENRSMNVTGTDSDGRQRLACVQEAARTALPWARRCRPARPHTTRTRCAGPRPTTRLAPLRPAPPRNVGPRRRPAAAQPKRGWRSPWQPRSRPRGPRGLRGPGSTARPAGLGVPAQGRPVLQPPTRAFARARAPTVARQRQGVHGVRARWPPGLAITSRRWA